MWEDGGFDHGNCNRKKRGNKWMQDILMRRNWKIDYDELDVWGKRGAAKVGNLAVKEQSRGNKLG